MSLGFRDDSSSHFRFQKVFEVGSVRVLQGHFLLILNGKLSGRCRFAVSQRPCSGFSA